MHRIHSLRSRAHFRHVGLKPTYVLVVLLVVIAAALGYVSYRLRQTDSRLRQTAIRLQLTNTELRYTQQRLAQANYGDLNHDGKVGLSDLIILSHHYGQKDAQ
jgi:hypothetical protein